VSNERGQLKNYIQLEGTLASVLLNLDGYLSTTDHPKVKDILKRYGFTDLNGNVRFLSIINVDIEKRIKKFSPINARLIIGFSFTVIYLNYHRNVELKLVN